MMVDSPFCLERIKNKHRNIDLVSYILLSRPLSFHTFYRASRKFLIQNYFMIFMTNQDVSIKINVYGRGYADESIFKHLRKLRGELYLPPIKELEMES